MDDGGVIVETGLQMRPSGDLQRLVEQTDNLIDAINSSFTLKAQRSDWCDFKVWCDRHHLVSLPTDSKTVALYISDLATCCAWSTIRRHLTAITKAHRAAGYGDSPASTRHTVVGETLRATRRMIGTAKNRKDPILTETIQKVIAHSPCDYLGFRDRALMLTGFAGALRRSELAALLVSDLEFTKDGVVVKVRSSGANHGGAGREVGLTWGSHPDTCPVRALRDWLERASISEGHVFRGVDRHDNVSKVGLNKDSIGRIVKRTLARAGFSIEHFAGHSLRAGLVTQAATNGVSEHVIMQQTGHKDVRTFRQCIRSGKSFRTDARVELGL